MNSQHTSASSSSLHSSGSAVLIEAHRRHRVTRTSEEPPAVWLAVHVEPEAKQREQAEKRVQQLRKDKANLENEVETQKATLDSVARLLDQVQALRDTCQQAQATIAGLSDKKKDQLTLPEFDDAAFEALQESLAKS